jgi:NAD(P)-dependent dehydrogenase (short-subunit alcohol dehydrogenase family)
MMKKIVITGVSTGIGFSTAKILCNSGYLVYGSVRKESDAQKTKGQFMFIMGWRQGRENRTFSTFLVKR